MGPKTKTKEKRLSNPVKIFGPIRKLEGWLNHLKISVESFEKS